VVLADNETAECLRLPAAAPTDPAIVAVAEAAVRLSRSLARQGWCIHQHHADINSAEPQSVPIPDALIPPQAADTIRDVQILLDKRAVDVPQQPVLVARTPHVSRDDTGILLPFAPATQPFEGEHSRTVSPTVDAAVKIWRELIPELATGWTKLPDAPPLSLGRFFLGPLDRLIYWPRLLNRALARIPISYDNITDLVNVLATLGFKVDLKAAFRSLIIADSHARFYGALVDGIYMQCHRAPFGSGVSPAHFVLHLRSTLNNVRAATPRTDQVLAAFVDDIGGASGADGPTPDHVPPRDSCEVCRQAVGLAAIDLTELGRRLTHALIADGWWIATSKFFLRPALRLYYTGAVADFLKGTVNIEPGKAAKLRYLLSQLTLPSDRLLASADSSRTPDPVIPPQIRTACAAERSSMIPIGAIPIVADQWPRLPWRIVLVSSPPSIIPSAWSDVPLVTILPGIPPSAAIQASMPTAGHQSDSLLHDYLLVITASVEEATDLIATDFSQPPTIRVILAYPAAHDHRHGDARWFDQSFALPPGTAARSLPASDEPPPPLPTTFTDRRVGTVDMTTVGPPRIRDHGSLDITDTDFATLRTIAGILSWFGVVVRVIGAWRPSIERVWRDGTWSAPAVDAVRFLWSIAPWLPGWTRDIRARYVQPLVVAVDAARCTWAARLTANGRTVWVAGTLPISAAAASTTAREAWGAASATQAAIRRRWRFDIVLVASDCSALVHRGDRGGVPTVEAGPPMRMLAAVEYQGVPIAWTWRSRYDSDAPLVDAVSSSARTTVWPLRRHIASFVFDGLPSGFHVDGPSIEGKAWTGRYYTLGPAEAQRRALFEVAALEAARCEDGWLGELTSHVGSSERVLFSHPAWSELAAVATLVEAGTPAVVVAPAEPSGEWWQPHLLRIRAASRQQRPLPLRSTVPPHTPGPYDPGYSDPGPHPVTGDRDARRLALYVCNITFEPRHNPTRNGRPSWWTPYQLTADGDVEPNPGPGGFIAGDDYGELVKDQRCSTRNEQTSQSAASRKRQRSASVTVRESRAIAVSEAPLAAWNPGTNVGIARDTIPGLPPPAKSRAKAAAHRPTDATLPPPRRDRQQSAASPHGPPMHGTRQGAPPVARDTPLPAAHAPSVIASDEPAPYRPDPRMYPSISDRVAREAARQPPPAAGVAPEQPVESRTVETTSTCAAHPPLTSQPPAPSGSGATLGDWCRDMLRTAAGLGSAARPVAPDGVAPANAHAYGTATRQAAARANKGSSKPVSLPEQLLAFATMRNVIDHPWGPAAAEGLVLDFSQCRLAAKPPLGWPAVTKAASVRADASRLAAASRRAGYQVPPMCGKAVDEWTATRGAKIKREHSAAFPVRLNDLLEAEPCARSPRWKVWAALVVTSLFCLRPGIALHLYRSMFVPYDGGFILMWRHTQKRTAADVDAATADEVSDVNAVTAARHPVLSRILSTAARDGRLFPTATADAMNAFVRDTIPDAPPGFDIRAHGLRTGADADADALQVPPDVVRAMFWWKREKSDMRAYYCAPNIHFMYLFSERRSEVIRNPLASSLTAAAVRREGVTDWRTPVATSLPTPPSIDDLASAATTVSPSFILSRRLRGSARTERARRALGLGPTQPATGSVAPILEGYCSKCFEYIGPKDPAAACECCDELACRSCHPDPEADFRCVAHVEQLPTRQTIAAKAKAAAAKADPRPAARRSRSARPTSK